jgi:ribosomal protein S18 acetylase RimI-like enzyme
MPLSLGRPWAFERGTLWALGPDDPVPVAPSPAGLTIGEVLAGDAAAVAALAEAMDAPDQQTVQERLGSGRRCFAASVEGSIAAYGWVSQGTERIGELERTMIMLPGEAYIWDCVTLPAFRRRGLYGAVLRHLAAMLRGEGLRRLWIGASLDNTPSIRGFRSAGFQPVIGLVYLRVLNLRHIWLAGDAIAPPALIADAQRAMLGGRALSCTATETLSRAGPVLPACECRARES